MGMFDSVTGNVTELKTQLFFYDDGSFRFIKRPFQDTCLIEKKNGQIIKAWAHFYNAELAFMGYKGIRADKIVLGFNRDFILDVFNKVKEATTPTAGGKPKKDDQKIKDWTKEIAESQRYKVMNKPGNMLLVNKITIFLGVTLTIEVLGLMITIARG